MILDSCSTSLGLIFVFCRIKILPSLFRGGRVEKGPSQPGIRVLISFCYITTSKISVAYNNEHLFLIPVTVGWLWSSSVSGCGSEVWLGYLFFIVSFWGPGWRGSSYVGYVLMVMLAGKRASPTMKAHFKPLLG